MEQTIFLYSNDLTDLKQLLLQVEKSANHLLMMSRQVLERPWVLCELVAAVRSGKEINIIAVGWPGQSEKEFHFPRQLDETISDWEDVRYTQRLREPKRALEDAENGTSVNTTKPLLSQCLKERPTNVSSWFGTRWPEIMNSLSSSPAPMSSRCTPFQQYGQVSQRTRAVSKDVNGVMAPKNFNGMTAPGTRTGGYKPLQEEFNA